VSSLDAILGGGLAIGSLLLVDEDAHGSYSDVLLKYFLSQGAANGHELLLGTAEHDPAHVRELDLIACVYGGHQARASQVPPNPLLVLFRDVLCEIRQTLLAFPGYCLLVFHIILLLRQHHVVRTFFCSSSISIVATVDRGGVASANYREATVILPP
jgi:hypothetical protein